MEYKAITLPESRDKDACYDFFFRVYRWWYNHNNDEALSKKLFRERYGRRMEATITRNGNPMTEYLADGRVFRNDRKNGALFMDMVMAG
ncbi:hypothetical protein [Parabacteroides gordonii]|uniref:hypothetical protein n=1 Tax=Parabacteroides gordonii TaxID=574930 RepID=UPI001CE1A00C|nr:hypothetical protein [Parabacteroides gordonii]MCA5586174.1 hypothetical protein [Parabacteroides gordonii]